MTLGRAVTAVIAENAERCAEDAEIHRAHVWFSWRTS